ncbi:MAG: dihydropteroate synthase, partial [Cyanobacteria bacterium P01_D01_bin.2]
RKSFIGWILDRSEPKDRVWGTAAACAVAIANGADILRVHDGAEMTDVARVTDAIVRDPDY